MARELSDQNVEAAIRKIARSRSPGKRRSRESVLHTYRNTLAPQLTAGAGFPYSLRRAERRVFIGYEDERVAGDPIAPPYDPNHEVEEAARVLSGEDDGEPGEDHRHDRPNRQKEEHDVMGNGQQPFHQRKPLIELARVGIGEIQVNGLLLVG